MRNLPLHDFAQDRIWLAVVQLAMELTAWMQLLALSGTDGRRWERQKAAAPVAVDRRETRPEIPEDLAHVVPRRALDQHVH